MERTNFLSLHGILIIQYRSVLFSIMKEKIIIRLDDTNSLKKSKEGVKINKLISSISSKDFVKLLSKADNKVNPRTAKTNSITRSIHETLDISPELFWFKSKGLLLATENCRSLERGRIEISLSNVEYEGIMDGGHNTFAIASFIALKLFKKKLRTWDECKNYWKDNYEMILEKLEENQDIFQFSVPIEIIYPNEDEGSIDDFYNYIAEICSARNNNVQLTETTKGNQVGYYDYLKDEINEEIKVIWKAGGPGIIKPEDAISMATIPLIYMKDNSLLPNDIKNVSLTSIYSRKSQCVDFFHTIMDHDDISSKEKGKYVLNNESVKSALGLTEEIMRFFDKLFSRFPELYNKYSPGFGRIQTVDSKAGKFSLFRTAKSGYTYPFAFIYPLVTGVMSLIGQKGDRLYWKISPLAIDLEDLDLKQYVALIKLVNYDAAKVGKQEVFYTESKSIFEDYIKD